MKNYKMLEPLIWALMIVAAIMLWVAVIYG